MKVHTQVARYGNQLNSPVAQEIDRSRFETLPIFANVVLPFFASKVKQSLQIVCRRGRDRHIGPLLARQHLNLNFGQIAAVSIEEILHQIPGD